MFPPILPYPAVVPVLHFHGNNIVSTISTVNDRTLFGDTVIEEGDFLWCDFGIIAMGLWTDTQHLGYVPTPRNFLEQPLWGSNLGGVVARFLSRFQQHSNEYSTRSRY